MESDDRIQTADETLHHPNNSSMSEFELLNHIPPEHWTPKRFELLKLMLLELSNPNLIYTDYNCCLSGLILTKIILSNPNNLS